MYVLGDSYKRGAESCTSTTLTVAYVTGSVCVGRKCEF